MTDQTKALQDSIRLGEVLERLKNNPEFKELILEGYINVGTESAMCALPYMATKESRDRVNDSLFAIAKFKSYLASIENNAKKSQYELDNINEEAEDE